jgi:hypothetical protein
MSYDLDIVTPTRPEASLFATLAEEIGLQLTHEPKEPDWFEVSREGDERFFNVWGPYHLEPEDVEPHFQIEGLDPKWTTQITIPYSVSEKSCDAGLVFARELARRLDGAAYDPQGTTPTFLWPPNPRLKVVEVEQPSQDKPRADLRLEWVIPSTNGERLADIVLWAAERFAPDARPTRYGPTEPLQHRLQRGTEDAFRAAVQNETLMLFWNLTKPFKSGYVSPAGPLARVRPEDEGLIRVDALCVYVDGWACRDPGLRRTVHDYFLAIAGEADAIYGRISLDRGPGGGKPADEYNVIVRIRGFWRGIPPLPSRLVWFGRAYKELLPSGVFDKLKAAEHGQGMVAGRIPSKIDVPEPVISPEALPPEYLTAKHPKDRLVPAAIVTRVGRLASTTDGQEARQKT